MILKKIYSSANELRTFKSTIYLLKVMLYRLFCITVQFIELKDLAWEWQPVDFHCVDPPMNLTDAIVICKIKSIDLCLHNENIY